MIHMAEENRVAAGRRQVRVVHFAFHYRHTLQLAFGNLLTQLLKFLRVNFRCVHSSGGAHMSRGCKRISPVSRSYVRHGGSRLPFHQSRQPLDFVGVIPGYASRKHGRRGASQRRQQEPFPIHRPLPSPRKNRYPLLVRRERSFFGSNSFLILPQIVSPPLRTYNVPSTSRRSFSCAIAALAAPDGTSARLVMACGAWRVGPALTTESRSTRCSAPSISAAISSTPRGPTARATAKSC